MATGAGAQRIALLGLSIVDPACGSGHFLLAAARRLASHVARLQANGTPSAAEYRHSLRQVVGRCIYGVDLNPMAVELCKVSLWMEAVEPGLPLTFLNSHIQHGNSLLGTTLEIMAKGIPEAAWEPIEGDDKQIAAALKKRNKAEATGQRTLDFGASSLSASETETIVRAVTDLDATSDVNVNAVAKKQSEWDRILDSAEYRHQKLVADAWCAAFVWPKQPGEMSEAAPTNEPWRRLRDGTTNALALTATTRMLVEEYHFFHWHLQFPQVFDRGGFDIVVGNPPWDSLRLLEKEFFAGVRADIAEAETSAVRKRQIAELETTDPALFRRYKTELRATEGVNRVVVGCGRYPRCGVGRINLFALFAEAATGLVGERGRVGQILPSGIVSDDSTKLFFQSVIERRQLVSFFDFENREGIFPAIDSRIRFGIFTLAGVRDPGTEAEFAFFATRIEHLKDTYRRFTLSADDVALLNPVTKTCPIFRSRRDAELTKDVYRRIQVLLNSEWRITLKFPLDVGRESGQFGSSTESGFLPLYEGKYFHQFDHRWVTRDADVDRPLTEVEYGDPDFTIRPRHGYPEKQAHARFGTVWKYVWTLAWRDITNATNERTFIASIVPSVAVAHSAWLMLMNSADIALAPLLLANINCYAMDFIARQKVGGTHMSAFIVEQLPFLQPTFYSKPVPWHRSTALSNWLFSRSIELTYTAWDVEPFANDIGYHGPPFRWNSHRRFLLRCELDAGFFHLYGMSRADADYVMDAFPIVRKNDEKLQGEYRTKRVILEIYDAMADATRSGTPYVTRLDPPPADSRIAHESRAHGVLATSTDAPIKRGDSTP